MTVGTRIKLRRKELGLSQTELADRMGLKNKSSICRVEKDLEPNLTSDRLMRFSDALYTTPVYLMGMTNDPNERFDVEPQEHGLRDAELLSVIRRLNDMNAQMLLQFAKTLLYSQNE